MTARTPLPVAAEALPPPEAFAVQGHKVACDGGGGALGHPMVWLEIGERGWVDCGYCDRRFVRQEGKKAAKGVKAHYDDPSPRHDDGH